jgi:hypothetical protein
MVNRLLYHDRIVLPIVPDGGDPETTILLGWSTQVRIQTLVSVHRELNIPILTRDVKGMLQTEPAAEVREGAMKPISRIVDLG